MSHSNPWRHSPQDPCPAHNHAVGCTPHTPHPTHSHTSHAKPHHVPSPPHSQLPFPSSHCQISAQLLSSKSVKLKPSKKTFLSMTRVLFRIFIRKRRCQSRQKLGWPLTSLHRQRQQGQQQRGQQQRQQQQQGRQQGQQQGQQLCSGRCSRSGRGRRWGGPSHHCIGSGSRGSSRRSRVSSRGSSRVQGAVQEVAVPIAAEDGVAPHITAAATLLMPAS